jgi:copper chaperone CopZ
MVMKLFAIKKVAAYVLSIWTLGYLPVSFSAESVKVTVNGMVCAFCAQGIEKRLTKLPATKAVFVDLRQRTVAVEAKDGQKLDQELIRAEITDAGYDVVKLEASALSVDAIKADLKANKK